MERPLTIHAGAKTATSPLSASFISNRASASTVIGSTSGAEVPPFSTVELQQQRMDIDRLLDRFEGLQKDMDSMKTAIDEIKKATKTSSRRSSSHAFAEELEILTENVSHVGNKANEVDGLKLELEMMKRRIKRVEEANAGTQSTHTITGLTPSSAAAPQTGRKSGPLARRSKNTENTSSGQVLPFEVSSESVRASVVGTTKPLPRDTDAGRQVIHDSAKSSPTLSGEEQVRKYRAHPEAQDLLHEAQTLLSQVRDASGLPRKVPQQFRSPTSDGPPESQAGHIENLGPGQTQDGSYIPSQDVDMDMDDSVEITQITDSALGSCVEPQARPGDVRRSTMTKLPLHSLPQPPSDAYATSPSSTDDDSSDQMDEESFRPSDPLPSDQHPDLHPQDPKNPSTTNQPATNATTINPTPPNHPPAPPSDPSDTDFRPHSRSTTTRPRARAGGRPRKSEPLRPTTPEWEKPDWPGPSPDTTSPYYAYGDNLRGKVSSARGRKVVRRGVSGSGGVAEGERAAKRMRGAGTGNGDGDGDGDFDGVGNGGDEGVEDEGNLGDGIGGEWGDGRVRDREGFLLLSSGKRDGRSGRRRRAGGRVGKVRGSRSASASASGSGGGSGSGRGDKVDGHERLMRQIFPGRGGA